MLRKSSLTLLSLYNFAMVAVLHDAPRAAAPQTVAAWLESLAPTYQPSVRETFATAFELARERCGDARLPDGEGVLDRGNAEHVAQYRQIVIQLGCTLFWSHRATRSGGVQSNLTTP